MTDRTQDEARRRMDAHNTPDNPQPASLAAFLSDQITDEMVEAALKAFGETPLANDCANGERYMHRAMSDALCAALDAKAKAERGYGQRCSKCGKPFFTESLVANFCPYGCGAIR